MNDTIETQVVDEVSQVINKPLIPKPKAVFVYRFESGNFNKVKYTVTAKTHEEALEKLRHAIGIDDVSKLKLEEMIEWKIENGKS